MRLAAVILSAWLLHPLNGRGYQFFSGIGSSINEWLQTLVVVSVGLWAYWHHHQCHVHTCHYREKRWLPHRLSWHPHPDHGHPVCKLHHPENPKGGGKHVRSNGTIHVIP